MEQVVGKSYGVFLWVFLAVRSLNEGLTNGDSISTLQRRLHLIPADLETFFLHMLHQVEPIYRSSMACTFQEALQAVEPMPLLAYSFLDEEDPCFAINLECQEMSKEKMKARNEKTSRRINGRCKGLLEVRKSWHWPEFWGNKVEFIHRTARDFLLTKEMQCFLQSSCDEELSMGRTLSRTYLSLIKTLPSWGIELLGSHIERCMYFAYNTEVERGTSDCVMLDELEHVMRRRCSEDAAIVTGGLDAAKDDWLFELAVTNGLRIYVQERLTKDNPLAHQTQTSILGYALHVYKKPLRSSEIDIAALVHLLLRSGISAQHAPIKAWLSAIIGEDMSARATEDRFKALGILIQYGADSREVLDHEELVECAKSKSNKTNWRMIQFSQSCLIIAKRSWENWNASSKQMDRAERRELSLR